MNYAFFIKGAVVASAAVSIVLILGTPGLPFIWIRLALWLASLALSAVTIATWTRGSAFATSHMNEADIFIPISMGTIEVAFFVVIAPTFDKLPATAWEFWYLALFFHLTLAFGLINNRLRLTIPEEYANELRETVIEYISWVRKDRWGVAGVALGSFGAFSTLRYSRLVFGSQVPLEGAVTTMVNCTIGIVLAAFALSVVQRVSREQAKLAAL
jgi:hypothetical protein